MIERLFVTLILAGVGLLIYTVFTWWHRQHLTRAATESGAMPTLLYFGSDYCAACPTQARYLEQLDGEWHGRLAIQKVDADQEPEKTNQYRVLTLPTTILIDTAGKVREINYGLTHTQKLSKQVAKIQAA